MCASLKSMRREEEKLVRQLSLVAFLLSKPRPRTAHEIREWVEGYADMSDETFTRRFYADRTDLARIGIDIRVVSDQEGTADREDQGFLLTEEDFRLPQVEFTPSELQALAVALAALDGRFAYARPLRLALTAIFQGVRDRLFDDLDELPVALAPDEDALRAGTQLAQLQEAVSRKKTVRFLYPTGPESAAYRERTLDPYSLFLTQGHWYVVGHDHDRDAIRTFRVTRIKGPVRFATERTKDFSLPPGYDPAFYTARPPWLLGAVKGQATVRVSEDLAWLVERFAPHVQVLDTSETGCSDFVVPYADEEMLLSWVVGLGSCGELLAPPELRDRLLQLLRELADAHTGEPQAVAAAQEPQESPRRGFASRRRRESVEPIPPERLARTITLLHYLLRQRGAEQSEAYLVSWTELEKDLGLVRREVEQDLALLNLVNFGGGTYALYAEAKEEGVEVVPDVMADAFVRPARLSPLMARSLLLALDLVGAGVGGPGLESLAAVREKIEALVGPLESPASVLVDDVLPDDRSLLTCLSQAIQEQRVVEIEYYAAARGELTRRQVEPYLLFRNPDGWYLEAYCLSAQSERTFKLERIRSVTLTGQSFSRRAEIDLTSRRGGRAFLPDQSTRWAEVKFDPRWSRYLGEEGISYARLADGHLRARVPYAEEAWLVKFTLRFLGQAVVEHPLPVRERVKETATFLARRYASPESRAHGEGATGDSPPGEGPASDLPHGEAAS